MKKIFIILIMAIGLISCEKGPHNNSVDKFADIEILRYKVPGFEKLPLKQKKLIYSLSRATLCGRDILYDQNFKYNLCIRKTFESVYQYSEIEKKGRNWDNFVIYLKEIWMANGIHHHYSTEKFEPGFSEKFLSEAILKTPKDKIPLSGEEDLNGFISKLSEIIFNKGIYRKRVNQDKDSDLILSSANNYYSGLTEKEVEYYYKSIKDTSDKTPVSYGLNSRLVKENGQIHEKVYKEGGLYGQAIKKIIYWLEKAKTYSENEKQKETIELLIEYYKTGNLKKFDEYNISWVEDNTSCTDFINGFIETYGDPLGLKGSWEGIVDFIDSAATRRTEIISGNAQWFEDHSPVEKKFKKEKVKGISAKVISVAMLGGDCYPATPIGINLPNSDWIRKMHGSKSVTLQNITDAYDMASKGNGFDNEFIYRKKDIELKNKYGDITDNLHTDLHECLGHGSGKLLPGIDPDALKSYGATIEEARADLFALYYIADKKLISLGLLDNKNAYKAEYNSYILNGLFTQLVRIKPGRNIEESHMRNRALIAGWAYKKGQQKNVIEKITDKDKTYYVINDYTELRNLFGELLREIQRIKSTGDYKAAKELVETYAVKIDPALHNEVLKRYSKLNIAPYKGFINPRYIPVYDKNRIITDIKTDYSENYIEQNLRYSKDFSFLPTYN